MILNGGAVTGLVELFSSPPYAIDNIAFLKLPAYKKRFLLYQKYVVEGLSIKQIAREILSSKEAVRNNLMKFDIPIRESGNCRSNPSNPRFGTRKINGKVVPHLGERRIISAVLEMHQKGISFNQIAKFLTTIGVPTKKQGKKWSHEMVRQIIYRKINSD